MCNNEAYKINGFGTVMIKIHVRVTISGCSLRGSRRENIVLDQTCT